MGLLQVLGDPHQVLGEVAGLVGPDLIGAGVEAAADVAAFRLEPGR
jgi:hypothetical protein